jgi:phosphoserine aminotransferase
MSFSDLSDTSSDAGSEPRQQRWKHNFSAGPSCVDAGVLAKLAAELADFEGAGMGLIEHSHRDVGGPVQSCMTNACALLREVMDIPDTHEVLLMHGGGHAMFAAIPLNLAGPETPGATTKNKAQFVGDGFWSKRAAGEASKYCACEHVAATSPLGDARYPDPSAWEIDPDAKFVHMTANETINGLEFHEDPTIAVSNSDSDVTAAAPPPLVADFTSTLLSRPVDFSKYGVVYASTGKNLGPSGLVVVIVRKDLIAKDSPINRELPITPGIMSFKAAAATTPIPNIWNTPNVFGVRALQLVLEDTKAKGGVVAMRERARRRAGAVYDVVDASDGFYVNRVEPKFRSLMTIPITIADKALEEKFVRESSEAGFYNLVGHPLFGGLRVTMYNQLPDDAVDALVEFMTDFYRENAPGGKRAAAAAAGSVAVAGGKSSSVSVDAYGHSPPSVLGMRDLMI